MSQSCQKMLDQLEPALRTRTIQNLERRFGITDLEKLSAAESEYVKREIEIYLWLEGEDSWASAPDMR